MERADHECCLDQLGSVRTPKCIIQWQKEIMMGKRDDDMAVPPENACAGRSLVEMMEDTLDGIFSYLKDTDMENADELDVAEKKGQAQGVAMCIAIIRSPYYPDVTAVKAEAVRRWEWKISNQ